MARMFGLITNRSDIAARVLKTHAAALRVQRNGKPMGWGLGFYQSGEVLLRRRPIDERNEIDLAEAAEDVRSDIIIGHVRDPSVGSLRTENTHPFRYRLWLFAQTGTILGYERLKERLRQSQPEFLRRNSRGDTDAELFFYLFLSFLHDAGHLDETTVLPEHIRAALRASISLVDRLSAEEGHPKNRGDILVTNGEHLLFVHRDGGAAMRVLKGRRDIENLGGGEAAQAQITNIDSTLVSLVTTGSPRGQSQAGAAKGDAPTDPTASSVPDARVRRAGGWAMIANRSITTFSRTDVPVSESL